MLNHSAEYAVRAVLYVARRGDGACSADAIAAATGVPRNYLGKVLHTLAHARVLRSVRGPHGGFRMAVPAAEVTLADVVGPFQRLPAEHECLLGDGACAGEVGCVGDAAWQEVTERIASFFETTTIARMVETAGEGRGDPGTEGSVR